MCIPILEVAGFEADDVIGTLSKRGAEAGYDVFMVTPDKDYGQLVDDHCRIYRQKGDAIEIIDKAAIKEKYGFDDPTLVRDMLALWGDASDNIPGVPGIGEKGACKLVNNWGTVENILDNTAVHPESYAKAEKLLSLFSYTKEDVKARKISDLKEKIKSYGEDKAAKETELDKATLMDIITELMKPGRDIRDALPAPMLRKDIMGIEDLKAGMELTGTVRNVVDFGAFIDIGVHQDGLVHISEITEKYIRHPSEVLKVGQIVQVWVKDVDVKKNRIGLTMKKKK
jgi:5'-3' exonuclease